MKLARVLIFVVVAAIQLAIPVSAIWSRDQILKNGRVWKFKTAPVDPVDAIRGRYISLRFDAERMPGPMRPESERIPVGAPVYAVLKENSEGFAEIESVSKTALKGDNVLKAEGWYWSQEANQVRFPFDRMWVSEDDAPAAEKAYFDNSRKGKQNAYVTVRIRNGEAVLEQMYIDNQPLPEYLRAHPQK